MNFNLDTSGLTRFFRKLVTELRDKRLWPVALALLVAIVAVPVALSKSSSPAPAPAGPQSTPPPSPGSSLPTISEQQTPSQSHLRSRARNPFTQQPTGATSTTSSTTSTSSAASAASSGSSAAGPSGGATNTGGSSFAATPTTGVGTRGSTTVPNPIIPTHTPKPAPSGLTATQAYDVALAITNGTGGFTRTDPLERLSVLPSDSRPQLVELGVAQGGNRVLFVVQPGTVVSGPGTCTPGPIDCEILSLGQDQTEQVSAHAPGSADSPVQFAITDISARTYSSTADAAKARGAESSVGRNLLNQSTLPALSLFGYDPSIGAVVDMRNLTVGGN